MMHLLRHVAFLCVLGTASSAALADVVVVDFDEITPGTYFQNLTSNGFRISPSCHVDVGPLNGASSNVMGWDASGCGPSNPDFLGQTPTPPRFTSVFVDYFENPFTLTSFLADPHVSGNTGALVTSSKGGVFDFGLVASGALVSVGGSQWDDIKWIEFSYLFDNGTPIIGLDNLTFRVPTLAVPEPSTISLLVMGAIALAAVRARRNRC